MNCMWYPVLWTVVLLAPQARWRWMTKACKLGQAVVSVPWWAQMSMLLGPVTLHPKHLLAKACWQDLAAKKRQAQNHQTPRTDTAEPPHQL